MLANSFGGSQRFGPEDFLPFRPPRRYLTVEEADAMMAKAFEVK